MRSAPVLFLVVLIAAGCGGHAASKVAEPPPPSLTSVCGGVPAGLHAQVSWLETGDGVRLYAASAGSGDRAVVLAHESGGAGLCGWLETMKLLAAHGFRTLAFDFRGTYPSQIPPARKSFDWRDDLQAALDAAGGKHAALVGASFGGAAAVAYAPDTADARRLVRRAGSKDKTVVLYPGTLHGWDILTSRPEARQLLVRWLTQRLR